MKEIIVTMHLYGAFKKYPNPATVIVPVGSRVKTVQEKLIQVLGEQSHDLVMDSVIANDKTILPLDYIIEGNIDLSILPPVCGG